MRWKRKVQTLVLKEQSIRMPQWGIAADILLRKLREAKAASLEIDRGGVGMF